MTTPDGGTVLITGANSGLGLECARELRRIAPNLSLVLASRDLERTSAVARDLAGGSHDAAVQARTLDLASLKDIRRFTAELRDQLAGSGWPPLRALVLNAGLQLTRRTASTDGYELTFAVNHLGHYLLSLLLVPLIETPARIVFVSSGTHDPAERTGMPEPNFRGARALADPNDDGGDPTDGAFGRRAYTTSKLCNVLCAYELSRRLEATGRSTPEAPLTVNAFDPGLMPGTGLARDYAGWQQMIWNTAFRVLRVLPNVNSTAASGAALASLLVAPEHRDTTRQYFVGRTAKPSSEESYDEDKARALWEDSADLVGLAPEERLPAERAATRVAE